jgi:energy-converting hydrogenase B subunit D
VVTALQVTILVLVAAGGTAVVAIRDPLRQAMVVSLFGILLAILFFVLQAPDVALSEIVVGAVAFPLMVLLSLAKIRGGSR